MEITRMLHFVRQLQRRFPRNADAIMVVAAVVVLAVLVAGAVLALSL